MLQLCQTILEQMIFRGDKIVARVALPLERHWARLVLQACHLECLHHDLIVTARCTAGAGLVEADDADTGRLVWRSRLVVELVFDGDAGARPQLRDEFASCGVVR